jgi:hypothetical protein
MFEPRRGGGRPRDVSSALLCSLIAFQSAAEVRAPFPKVDPYTLGEPEALARAGYGAFGPIPWGDGHRTDQIERELGGIPLIWVETAHFRLGSSLPEYRVGEDAQERAKLRAELQRLGQRLPRIDKKTLRLDPWLRLHLSAQRAEDLYASFCAKLGLEEADFAASPAITGKPSGPHLGMGDKFTVLLLQETSALDRYCRTFLGHQLREDAVCHYFKGMDGLFLGVTVESLHDLQPADSALHFAFVYDLVLNFDTAFRGVILPGPHWWRHGLARWFAREVDPRILLYATPAKAAVRPEEDSEWPVRVRARVEKAAFPATAAMLDWKEYSGWSFADHMIAWSRVDYLLNRGDGAARRFFLAIHEPVPWVDGRDERVAAQLHGALEAVTGLSPEAFDEAWCKYVKATYKRR